jgi:hypothetical protein
MQPHGTFPQLSCQSIRTTDLFKLGEPSNFHRLSIEKRMRVTYIALRSGLHVLDVVWQQRNDLPFGLVRSATDRTVLLRCGLQVHFAIPMQKATINFLISLLLLVTEQFFPDRGLWNFLLRTFTVAPCISMIHLLLVTNKCTKTTYYSNTVLIIHIKTS